uniref:AI-2E family transporter n=2 Tax=Chrysotila carterae TaxID=13221 RepID=A0A7S4B3S1_CHRCT
MPRCGFMAAGMGREQLPLVRNDDAPRNPLLGALSVEETRVEERIRTLALCVMGLAVVGAALSFLRAVLVPFVLALALRHLLQPFIEALTERPIRCCGISFCSEQPYSQHHPLCLRILSDMVCRLKLPHWLAVLVTLLMTFGLFCVFGLVIADSVQRFASRAELYSEQVRHIFNWFILWLDKKGLDQTLRLEKLNELAAKLPLTNLVLAVIESLLSLLSNSLLVGLFTVFLLLGDSSHEESETGSSILSVSRQADMQIRIFIKGKVLLSFLVGALTALILWILGVELWLVFAVLAFWLNFIPNLGAVIATLLPVPAVAFNPSFGTLSAILAIVLPLILHALVGNVLEPIAFGHTLELHPVVVLLSLMLWGTLWGVPGLVLAVPVTAVARIHLAHIDHPLPRYIASVLVGKRRKHPVQELHELLQTENEPLVGS